MANRDVELLAIGAGPSNLALAVGLEEVAPHLARNTLLIDRDQEISWQRGMMMPEVQSNVTFLKDLATMRNPRSKFTFVNYLHSMGRLHLFANMTMFTPFRLEIAKYLKWAGENLSHVQVQLGKECAGIRPLWTAGAITGWETELTDGDTIRSRYLSIGIGRDARIPDSLSNIKAEHLIHSTQYRQRIDALPKDVPYRVVVVGAGQSAGEMYCAVMSELPECRPTLVMRSIGFNYYETSKFNNELYYSSFTDIFHASRPEARTRILAQMRHTNYAGLAPDTMEWLYRQFYLDRLLDRNRLQMINMHDVTAARDDGSEVVLELTDWRNGSTQEIRADLVLLGTGFSSQMPWLVRKLADSIGLPEITVSRNYRLIVDRPSTAACYLQGVNETTHGIADSLLSLLAARADDVIGDIQLGQAALSAPGGVPDTPEAVLETPGAVVEKPQAADPITSTGPLSGKEN